MVVGREGKRKGEQRSRMSYSLKHPPNSTDSPLFSPTPPSLYLLLRLDRLGFRCSGGRGGTSNGVFFNRKVPRSLPIRYILRLGSPPLRSPDPLRSNLDPLPGSPQAPWASLSRSLDRFLFEFATTPDIRPKTLFTCFAACSTNR